MVKVVILAGGKGTRLRPYTYFMPKPMLPVNQKPMLEHIITSLSEQGFKDIYITVGYLGYQIRNYFGDGSRWGVNIKYSEEDKPLGNAGSLSLIKDELKDETFLVIAGDNLSNINYNRFLEFHREKGGTATIALIEIETNIEFGIADVKEDTGEITRFIEKPTLKHFAATMIYALEPEILNYIDEGKDFAKDVFPALLREGKRIFGYIHRDYWMDVGRIKDYELVNNGGV